MTCGDFGKQRARALVVLVTCKDARARAVHVRMRVHWYWPCNSRVSWCAYLYVIYPPDSGVTSARTRAMGCFMVRMVHEATIMCNTRTSTGGVSPVACDHDLFASAANQAAVTVRVQIVAADFEADKYLYYYFTINTFTNALLRLQGSSKKLPVAKGKTPLSRVAVASTFQPWVTTGRS